MRRPGRRVSKAAGFALLLLALGISAAGQTARAGQVHGKSPQKSRDRARAAWSLAKSNPTELVRRASKNELANSHRTPVRFRLRKITPDSDKTKEIVETREGGVARLVAIDGHPLSAEDEKKEIARLRDLASDPGKQADRRKSERKDAKRTRKFTRLLPEAFLYRYAGQAETPDGAMIRLKFWPNPKFSPPDFASRVMTGLRGELWIEPEQLRIVRIQCRIFRKVDFGWGILGVLYPGGTMRVEQSKTPKCGWQLTRLSFHLKGKELIFKSIDISVEETAGDYAPVPSDWGYRDAIRWLLRMPT